MTAWTILFAITTFVGQGPSQSATPPDTQIQQQILEELRAIHRDMRTSSTLQLLLTELQITQASLDSANQSTDRLKTRLAQLQVEKAVAQREWAQYEEGISKFANPSQEFVDRLNQLKADLEKAVTQEKVTSDQLREAESRMRTAQSERDNVQAQLGDLVKKLSSSH
jgi:chromosome segregation ATPase